MKQKIGIEKWINGIFIFLLAIVFTYKAPIRYLDFHNNEGLASLLGTLPMYGAIIFAILIVITRKDYLKYTLYTIIFFALLYCYQKFFVPTPSLNLYWPTFFVNGIGGFLCGIALSEPQKLIKATGTFALIYGILLIPEPITRSLLGYTSMSLGYTMAPLTIWLIMLYHFSEKHKKIIFSVAAILGVMTILFTSRGCGISVLAAAIIIKIIETKKRNESISKLFIGLTFAAIIALFAFRELAVYFTLRSNISLLTGSTLNKLINGVVSDDNGRTKLLNLAIELFQKHWVFGVGMGADRQIIGYVFPHNVFIEVLLHFGLFLGLIMFICYWKPVVSSIRETYYTEFAAVLPAMCCIYWIRLLFSDSYLSNCFGLMFIFGFSMQIICKRRTGELYERFSN